MFGSMGASGVLGMGVMMTLYDDFSGSADHIQSKMKSLIGVTDEAAKKITAGLGQIKTGFTTLAVGLALVMPLEQAVTKAAELSDQMADVRKTTNMTTQQVEGLVTELKNVDTRTATKNLMDIAKIGGQLGVATDQIYDFTVAIDKANVALGDEFSGGAEEITKQLGTIKDLFQETKNLQYGDAMNKIGSALNSLGAAGKATGDNIANFTNRIGALGIIAPSLNETLALGATLQEVGVNGQIAAGGLTALLLTANKVTANKDRMAQWAAQMNLTKQAAQQLFNSSRADFILTFAKSFQGLAPTEVTTRMTKMGIESDEAAKILGSLSNNTDLYASRLALVNDQLKNATSLTAEFNIKNETLGAIIDKMKKSWDDAVTSIGQAAAPVFTVVYEIFKKITDIIRRFAESDAGKFIIKGLAIIGIFITLVGAMLIVKGVITILIAIMPALGAAIWAALAPILPIVIPIIAAIAALYYAWKSFTDFLNGQGEVESGFLGFLQRVGGAIWTVIQVFKSWNGDTFDLGGMEDKLQEMGILQAMINLGTWVVRLKELFIGAWDAISESFGEVGAIFKEVWGVIGKIFDQFGIQTGKAFGSTGVWKTIGYIIGKVVSFGLVTAFKLLGYTLLALVNVVKWVVDAITTFIGWMKALWDIAVNVADAISSAFAYVVDAVSAAWNFIKDVVVGIVDWFIALPDKMIEFGKNMVQSILQGLKESWHLIKDFLTQGLSFLGPLNPFDTSTHPMGQMVPAYAGVATQTQTKIVETEQMRMQATGQTQIIDKSTVTAKSVTVPVYLSGEKVAEHVVDIMGNEDSRN